MYIIFIAMIEISFHVCGFLRADEAQVRGLCGLHFGFDHINGTLNERNRRLYPWVASISITVSDPTLHFVQVVTQQNRAKLRDLFISFFVHFLPFYKTSNTQVFFSKLGRWNPKELSGRSDYASVCVDRCSLLCFWRCTREYQRWNQRSRTHK